jgi:hypothetical protein
MTGIMMGSSNFPGKPDFRQKMDPRKAKRTCYFSEGRKNTPSDPSSTPE